MRVQLWPSVEQRPPPTPVAGHTPGAASCHWPKSRVAKEGVEGWSPWKNSQEKRAGQLFPQPEARPEHQEGPLGKKLPWVEAARGSGTWGNCPSHLWPSGNSSGGGIQLKVSFSLLIPIAEGGPLVAHTELQAAPSSLLAKNLLPSFCPQMLMSVSRVPLCHSAREGLLCVWLSQSASSGRVRTISCPAVALRVSGGSPSSPGSPRPFDWRCWGLSPCQAEVLP